MNQDQSDSALTAPGGSQPLASPAAGPAAVAGLAALLARVTGEDAAWAGQITAHSRLEGDLGIDSLELAELAAVLGDAYGRDVDLIGFLSGLELEQITALTVGDLMAYLGSAGRVGTREPGGIRR